MNDLAAILKRVGVTTIYVTHDQEEAFAVADRIMIMQGGSIWVRGDASSNPARPKMSTGIPRRPTWRGSWVSATCSMGS